MRCGPGRGTEGIARGGDSGSTDMPSQLDFALASVALLGNDRVRSDAQAAAVAAELGPAAIDAVAKRLRSPPLTAKAAGDPSLRDCWGRLWFDAVAEVLFRFGEPALPHFWPLLEQQKDTYREYVVERLLRFAADGVRRDEILERMRREMPKWHETEVIATVQTAYRYSKRDPRVVDTLRELKDVPIRDYEDTIEEFVRIKDYESGTLGNVIRAYLHEIEVAQEHAARAAAATRPAPPAEPVAEQQFASQFAQAIVDQDFKNAQGLLAAHLKTSVTAADLRKVVADNTEHSGKPDGYEVSANDETASSLRSGPLPTPLPAAVTDGNFRKWMCIHFLPVEAAGVDACFDLWMAVIDDGE